MNKTIIITICIFLLCNAGNAMQVPSFCDSKQEIPVQSGGLEDESLAALFISAVVCVSIGGAMVYYAVTDSHNETTRRNGIYLILAGGVELGIIYLDTNY